MGNKSTTTTMVHYPHELIEENNKFKIIPIMMSTPTPSISSNRNLRSIREGNLNLESNKRCELYDNLEEMTYGLIIIMCSNELSLFNYNEISTRLSANKMIVICVNVKNTNIEYDTVITNITNNLKKGFMIKYMKNLMIDSTTICGHKTSYGININNLAKKYNLILLDPVIEKQISTPISLNQNIYMILPSDYADMTKKVQMMKKITDNICVLSDIPTKYFYNALISNLNEINEKTNHWDQITKIIINISRNKI